MNLEISDLKKINRSILACVLVTAIISQFNLGIGVAISVGFALLIIKNLFYKSIKKTNGNLDNLYTQLESYQRLICEIKPVNALPNTRGWAGSPDFLINLCELIKQEKPSVILEASSGASTIVSGYSVQQHGGRVFSLEHEKEYAEKTNYFIEQHKLSNVCEVIYAPLISYNINNVDHKWYDISSTKIPSKIDLIIIDGPPTTIQNHARFPAMPLLIKKLNIGGLIVLDDSYRSDEKAIISQWLEMYPEIKEYKMVMAEKGMAILKKSSPL